MARMAHGTFGLVARLMTSSAVQRPPAMTVMAKARRPVHATSEIRGKHRGIE
jgi:hypothetical protein